MEYRLLGPVEVLLDGKPLDLGVYKQRALLALLLINANQVVSTDRIIDELWSDSAGRDRQKALWVVVSRLRSVLEPDRTKRTDGSIILSRPPGYLLSVDATDIDATRFEALATEGRALLDADPAAASLVLTEALALWRGHPLEEFTYEEFAAAEVTRLEELRLAAVENRIDADLRVGRARELIGELESLVRQHPARERMTAHLMLALHLAGRQGDALRAFGTLRTHLAEELGLEPSANITKLEERIVLDDPSLRQRPGTGTPSGPQPGLAVRGYELRDKIGQGAVGNVYRAFQPAVGREVAIKVIRPELANDPAFIRRFETEARAIAQLEHPQIVPVFDYWREPDAAFLVMRRFEHGSLRDVLDEGSVPFDRALDVVQQVGRALAAAHRRGVTHGDVKPENVLLDGDGHAYLTDFGMSYGPAGAKVDAGSATSFVAPEQVASGQVTVASDVFSLGALAAEALGEALSDATSVSDVITRATAARPGDRFDNVESFTEALAVAGGDSADAALDVADVVNPYRGLHAFGESDAGLFFGRERLVERLLARLGHTGPQGRFVAVVGPSGSGKSSVVRAGVIPALRQAAVPGSDGWFIATMTPGRHPFEALEDALRAVAVDPPGNLLEQLTSEGITSAVESLIADPSAQMVIVIDQLEELFALADRSDADAFMFAIAEAARDRHSSVKVIATLRADFYDRPLRHPQFGELLRLGTEVITPMDVQELERAITAPVADLGVAFEAGLVAQIASDMAGQSTALPLLQYALTELFEHRAGATITMDAYRELGGVSAALARRADGLYEGLSTEEQARSRDVFLRLVTLNEGGADTRRRALLRELNGPDRDATERVLDAFGRHRLLSFDRDVVTRGPTVEIAHEALLTEWKRLRDWIDDARVDLQAERSLAAAEAEWRERDQDPDFLLTGARLGRYDGWLEHPPVALTSHEHDYLAASHDQTAAELEAERRRVRRLRRLVVGVGMALVLALIAGGIAFQQQRRADDEAQRAEAEAQRAGDEAQRANEEAERAEAAAADAIAQTEAAVRAAREAELATLISRSAAVSDDDPELSLLLALEAHGRAPGPDTDQALLSALAGASIGNRVASRAGLVDDCAGRSFFPQVMAGAAELATIDGRMIARDPVTGETSDTGPAPGACVIGVRTPTGGGAVALDLSRAWVGSELEVALEFDTPTSMEWSTDDRIYVRTVSPPSFVVLDVETLDPVGEPISGGLIGWATNEDSSLVALSFSANPGLGGEGSLVVIDGFTAEVVFDNPMPVPASAMVFDEARGHLVTGLFDGRILTVDPASGATLFDVAPPQAATGYSEVGIRPDGAVITITRSGIDLVDRTTGRLAGSSIALQDIAEAYVRDDGLIVTRTDDGQVDVFDLDAIPSLGQTWDVDPFTRAAFADGRVAILDEATATVDLVDLATGARTGETPRRADGRPLRVNAAFPQADGLWVVTGDHTIAWWDGDELGPEVDLGSEPEVIPDAWYPSGSRHEDWYATLGQRPDGRVEASLMRLPPDGSTEMPEVAFVVETTMTGITRADDLGMVIPTPDGGLYLVESSGASMTYDATGELVAETETPATRPNAIALDPTGSKLAIGSLDGGIYIVDTTTGAIEVVPVGGVVSVMGFDGDGSTLVLAMFDGALRLYAVGSGIVPVVLWTGSTTFDAEPGWYDSVTDTVWIRASTKLAQVPVSSDRWVERACTVVARGFTQDQWDQYVPGDEPLRSAC